MLHVLVNTHEADACAFRSDGDRDRLTSSLASLEQHAGSLGLTIQGAWMNMAGHTLFAVIDAPNAHAVEDLVRDAGLVGWTTTRVYPVRTMQEMLQALSGS